MNNRERDDFSLYQRFLSGDERALSLLIDRYKQSLLRFLYGYVQDEDVAEELFSDVFLALYFKRTFTPKTDSGLKPYLYKIARNKALNHLKKIKRRKEISLENLMSKGEHFQLSALSSADIKTLDPHEILEQKTQNGALRFALAGLKREYREVLLLRYYDDLSPKEIAQVLQQSEKQVYNRLQRGKAALKKAYLQGGNHVENNRNTQK